jgi:hypothetical protein
MRQGPLRQLVTGILCAPLLLSSARGADGLQEIFDMPASVWITSAAGLGGVVAVGSIVGKQKPGVVLGETASGLLGGAILGGALGGGMAAIVFSECSGIGCSSHMPIGIIIGAAAFGITMGTYLGIKLYSMSTGIRGNDRAALLGVYLSTLAGALLAAALRPENETRQNQERDMLVPFAIVFPNLGGVLGFNLKVKTRASTAAPGSSQGAMGLALEKTF